MSSRSDTIHPILLRIDLEFINIISDTFLVQPPTNTHPAVALKSLLSASQQKVSFEHWIVAAKMVSVLRMTWTWTGDRLCFEDDGPVKKIPSRSTFSYSSWSPSRALENAALL